MTITASHWVYDAPTVPITSSADLDSTPSVAFVLAVAPDGMPLAIHIQREVDVREPVLAALRRPDNLQPEMDRALGDLERAARSYAINLGVVKAGGRLFYETVQSISTLFGHTLLARVLGAASPMVLAEDVRIADASRFVNTSAGAHREELVPGPPPTFGRDARLWIGVAREPLALAVPYDPTVGLEDRRLAARPIVFESLLALRSARWHVVARDRPADDVQDGQLLDQPTYRRALRDAGRVGWSVSRADAARLVAELARSVDREWHAKKRVHCDLKPGNVLLLQTAITAFDPLDVAEGETCVGVTEGWAAPEQVFVRPVSAATDVFALGLMAASAVSAAVYGEERAVVVPAAGSGRRRLRMMMDPEVWIDPNAMPLPTPARAAWRELLVQCMAADPEKRPRRGLELANRLDELLAKWELPGRVQVRCGPGEAQLTHGGEPMWVLTERR
jgi:hypothetical protein